MEVDERKTSPSSLEVQLFRQVEEQSELCDVTVQVGTWVRSFSMTTSASFMPVFNNFLLLISSHPMVFTNAPSYINDSNKWSSIICLSFPPKHIPIRVVLSSTSFIIVLL